MAFSIVEFEEGDFNVVCTKWLYEENDSLLCFWPRIKTSKEYYKIVQKLTIPNIDEWEKATVTNVLGRYGKYNFMKHLHHFKLIVSKIDKKCFLLN